MQMQKNQHQMQVWKRDGVWQKAAREPEARWD